MANKKHEAQSLQQIVVVYGSDLVQGLAHDQVNSNRQLHGTNEFPKAYHTWLRLLLRQFNSGFTYLLAVAAVVSFFLGEHSNAIIMLGIIFFMGLFGFYQEFYADRTLQDLRARLRTSVRIIRGGREVTIDAQEIVVGDLVLFEPGDAVCADVRLVQQDGLLVDESVLRGESQPVSKMVITEIPSSIGSAQCLLLTGTKIVAGTAKGIVVAVGAGTMYGRLVNISVRPGRPSNFAQGINTFSLFVLIFVCVAVGGIFISHLLIQGASLNLVQLLVFYISLAVAVVPQALQVVINFSLARVAALLARRHVLVKRFAALEDLSGVEVLCVDKTGTLTENHLTVANVWASSAISSTEVLLAAYQGVATRNHKEPDPFDRALVQAVREGHVEQKSVTILKQIPFDPLQKCNVTAVTWHGGACVVVRGALEAVLKRCQADIEAVVALRAWVNEQEALGQRVLVIALGEGSNVHDLHALRLVGAIAFQDGIKKSAYAALEQARAMHIVVKMLTGDSAVVARQVAQALGIFAGQEEILTGDTYDELSEVEKNSAAMRCNVFARVSPLQKCDIIARLEQHFDVGFVGEGVNDVPSIKMASVGFAVLNATDVAKDAADLVLLSRGIETIIEAARYGRAVFVNTTKYLHFTLASNFSNFYSLAIISLFSAELPMLPVQLLALNVLSDIPMIFIATDNVEQAALARPTSFDIKKLIMKTMAFGGVCTLFDLLFFSQVYPEGVAVLQSNWFVFSVLSELVLFFPLRSAAPFWRAQLPSMQLLVATLAVASVGVMLPFTSFGQDFFHLQPLQLQNFYLIAGILVLNVGAVELAKPVWYRYAYPAGT